MTIIGNVVRRQTHGTVWDCGKRRPVIVSLEPPNLIGFRLKGTRRTYYLTADGCYVKAVQLAVAAAKREKKKAKQEKH